MHAFIACRLDYRNSVLYGVLDRALRKLQLVQNSDVGLITGLRNHDYITAMLRDQLHWLPMKQRITYKIAVFVLGCLRGAAPRYLVDMLTPMSSFPRHQRLRTSAHHDLFLKDTSHLATRSFRQAGPAVWNSLPIAFRDPSIFTEHSKKLLKTHPFNIAY